MTDKEEKVLKAIRDLKDQRFEISYRSVASLVDFSHVTVSKVFNSLLEKGLLEKVGGKWVSREEIKFSSLKDKLNAYIEKAQRENLEGDPARKQRISERRRRVHVEKQKDTFIPFGPTKPVYKASPPPDAPFEAFLR